VSSVFPNLDSVSLEDTGKTRKMNPAEAMSCQSLWHRMASTSTERGRRSVQLMTRWRSWRFRRWLLVVRMRGRRTWTKFALLGPYPSFGTLLERVGSDSQFPVNLLYFGTGPTGYISPTFLLAGRCPSQCTAGRKVTYRERYPVNSTTPHPVPSGAASLVRQQGTEQRGVSKAPNLVHVLLPRVLLGFAFDPLGSEVVRFHRAPSSQTRSLTLDH
jgi:hypothetical protein